MVPSWFLGTLLVFEQWLLNERALEGLKAIAGVAAVATVMTIGADAGVAASAADVVGMGSDPFIACLACLSSAWSIIAGGPVALLTALYYPDGAYLGADCIATCIAAVS